MDITKVKAVIRIKNFRPLAARLGRQIASAEQLIGDGIVDRKDADVLAGRMRESFLSHMELEVKVGV